MKLIDCYLLVGGLGSGVSVVLYYLLPEGTVRFFGGEVSPTSVFWCRNLAGGDALYSYLCFLGMRSSNGRLKQQIIRGLGIFSALHFSAFYIGHVLGPQQPGNMASGHLWSLAIAGLTTFWWGFYRPPLDGVEDKKAN